jgi:hypothetical protein
VSVRVLFFFPASFSIAAAASAATRSPPLGPDCASSLVVDARRGERPLATSSIMSAWLTSAPGECAGEEEELGALVGVGDRDCISVWAGVVERRRGSEGGAEGLCTSRRPAEGPSGKSAGARVGLIMSEGAPRRCFADRGCACVGAYQDAVASAESGGRVSGCGRH